KLRADPTYMAADLADPSRIGPWVRKAVRRKLINHMRKEKRERERYALIAEEQADSKHGWMEAAEEQAATDLETAIRLAVPELPERRREAYLRVREDGYTYEQAA